MTRFSAQRRAPEPVGSPHPRAVALARTAAIVASAGTGVSISDLFAAGFTTAELIEHLPSAERIANGGSEA